MEAFKLAFETVIIGLFALPWLWVMMDLVNPDLFNSSGISRLIAFIPTELRPSAIGLTLFSLVYLMGSMITPVACEFLNDSDMLGKVLPTEENIQAWAYTQMSDPPPIHGVILPAKAERVTYKGSNTRTDKPAPEDLRQEVHNEFQHEESTLLLHGPDGTERLNRLHEQLTVLRGATFSAFALMVLCAFAWFGRCSKDANVTGGDLPLWELVRRSTAVVLAWVIILVAGLALRSDLHPLQAGDMPIAELVLMVLGGFGLFAAICGTRSRLQFHGLTFFFALCFAALCYAGYGCTAASYDQAVFNTYQALPAETTGNSSHSVTLPVFTTAILE